MRAFPPFELPFSSSARFWMSLRISGTVILRMGRPSEMTTLMLSSGMIWPGVMWTTCSYTLKRRWSSSSYVKLNDTFDLGSTLTETVNSFASRVLSTAQVALGNVFPSPFYLFPLSFLILSVITVFFSQVVTSGL